VTDREIVIDDAIDVFLERKAVGDPDGPGAGAYATNAESILRRFATWLECECGVTSFVALESTHLHAYAIDLADRVDRGEYTASSAETYYAVVRAFLSWCVDGAILTENPARNADAEAALPTPESDPEDSSWSAQKRRRLETYVAERALTAGRKQADDRTTRLREHALLAVLAYSGARGSELFRVPEDDGRTGATWDDVDFYTGTIRVLGRSRQLEEVTVLGPARTALRRYRVVLDPPSNDWPLFPTRHAPSIARRVREGLADRGHDDDAIERLLEEQTATELSRERAIAPPAITTEGARSVLKRLCERAGVDVDGEYLTPRGVRSDRLETESRRDARPTTPQLRTSMDQSIVVLEQGNDRREGDPSELDDADDG